MRVAIYGSLRSVDKDHHDAFKKTCVKLGVELAKRGDVPLLHSEGKKTADRFVFKGVAQYADNTKSKPRVEVHRTVGTERLYPDSELVHVTEVPYPADEDHSEEMADKRLGPRVGTIAGSDIVVLIGGSNGTRRSGAFSRQLKKPILAIPCFGGSAEDLYSSTMEELYLADERITHKIGELSQPTGDHPHAAVLIQLCQTLAGLHAYFVSYAHKDSADADRVEVVLRRANRHIRRDERDLSITDEIKDTLRERMAKSDTFVCLWSKNSANSDWCQWECDTAREMLEGDTRLRRVVMIKIDNKSFKEPWDKHVQLDGTSPAALDAAVQNLINSEILET